LRWTRATVLDAASGRVVATLEEAEELRWIGGSRYLLGLEGNKRTSELRETDPPRTIQVWAKDIYLHDLERGIRLKLIEDVSFVRGYDAVVKP
jgi:hypothetical protein